MEIDQDSKDMIKHQIMLIVATKGCSFLIMNVIMILHHWIERGYIPLYRIHLTPFVLLNYVMACSVFFLPSKICRLCLNYTTCMVTANIIYNFIIQYISDHYVILREVFCSYGIRMILYTLTATVMFYFLKKPIVGYISLTLGFLTMHFLIEYASLVLIKTSEIMLLPTEVFFDFLIITLESILISAAYLITIVYTPDWFEE